MMSSGDTRKSVGSDDTMHSSSPLGLASSVSATSVDEEALALAAFQSEHQAALDYFQESKVAAFQDAFCSFDLDDSGTIDVHELQCLFQSLGQAKDAVECEEMILEVDANDNMEVDFDEFLVLMYRLLRPNGQTAEDQELALAVMNAVKRNRTAVSVDRAILEIASDRYSAIVFAVNPIMNVCYVESLILSPSLALDPVVLPKRYLINLETGTALTPPTPTSSRSTARRLDSSRSNRLSARSAASGRRRVSNGTNRQQLAEVAFRLRFEHPLELRRGRNLKRCPVRIIRSILSFVPISSLPRASLVSSSWYRVSVSDYLWRALYLTLMRQLCRVPKRTIGETYREAFKRELFSYSWDDLIQSLPDRSCRMILYRLSYRANTNLRSKFVFLHWSPPLASVEEENVCTFSKPNLIVRIMDIVGKNLVSIRSCDRQDLRSEEIVVQCVRDDQKSLVVSIEEKRRQEKLENQRRRMRSYLQ